MQRQQCQPHRKTDGIGSLLCLIIIIFYFPENSGTKEITHTHTHTNVDVEEIKDSLRMAWSSHLHFSSDTESAYCREKNEKTNFCCCYCFCDYSATPCPRVRPVTNHILQPLFRLLSFQCKKAVLSEKHDATVCCRGLCSYSEWGWGEGSCLWSLQVKTRGRCGGHMQSAFRNAGE